MGHFLIRSQSQVAIFQHGESFKIAYEPMTKKVTLCSESHKFFQIQDHIHALLLLRNPNQIIWSGDGRKQHEIIPW